MALLEIIFVFGLLFEVGKTGKNIHLFHSSLGQDVTLPCGSPSSSPPSSCSPISWLYNQDPHITIREASEGKVTADSDRAARLSVDTSCSLVIKHITSDDVGRYTCRRHNDDRFDVRVYLRVLTISEQRGDDEVTLVCSLLRYRGLRPCTQNGLQWMNETGTVLHEGVQKKNRGVDCLSHLTVKHQSSNNRSYTCQFVSRDKVEIQDDYTVQFTETPPSLEWALLRYFMWTLRITGLIFMTVITVIVIRHRESFKATKKDNENDVIEVSYENVPPGPSADDTRSSSAPTSRVVFSS